MKYTLEDRSEDIYLESGGVISFYRQPGGCVEISDQESTRGEIDILHFCNEKDALAVIDKFQEFIIRTREMVENG